MRTHLYLCTIVPYAVRQRAQAVRDAARILVKQSGGLRDQADVLMRVAEAAAASLRETMAKVAATERRHQTGDRREDMQEQRHPHQQLRIFLNGLRPRGGYCVDCLSQLYDGTREDIEGHLGSSIGLFGRPAKCANCGEYKETFRDNPYL